MANEKFGKSAETALNEALDKKAEKLEKWIPEKAGDRLLGLFVGSSNGKSEDTQNLTFLEIEKLDGIHVSILSDTVLSSQFREQKVVAGDKIGLEFLGVKDSTRKGRDGLPRQYKSWKVVKI